MAISKGWDVAFLLVDRSTYQQCCDLTQSHTHAGQLRYLSGHEGLGVVFASGIGDGVYDVYATYRDLGKPWGRRIVKVEILLA